MNTSSPSPAADHGRPTAPEPSGQVAVVTCMDVRLDIDQILGLRPGEAHILRNAGGVVTDDVIRSLLLSQRLLGTRRIVLVQHTDCGLSMIEEESFAAELVDELGMRPGWRVEAFSDPAASVRRSIARLEASPFIPHSDRIEGFVYDVVTGELHPVT